MSARIAAVAMAVAAASSLAWWLLRDEAAPEEGERTAAVAPRSSDGPSAPVGAAGSRAVLGAAPSRPAVAAPPPKAAPPTLYGEFLKSKSHRALYDRLQGSPESYTPEGKLVLYELLRECATVTGGRRAWRPSVPKREDFVAGIAATDPMRDKRIAAFDAFTTDRCAGFEGVTIAQADLTKLLEESAAGGDPRARALAIEQELWRSRRSAGDGRTTLSDAQIDSLKQAVATRDPEAIRVAGRVMSNSWSDYALRLGAEQAPVEPKPFMNAWLVLACEYGAPCGADTPRMLQACALQGHCNADSYPDYLF
ncbi:MAG TPA: hypothetical protein VFK48_05970, partial [Usitatibacter sp.]|nr:hypothetical protein [Usitatibacter sp.]